MGKGAADLNAETDEGDGRGGGGGRSIDGRIEAAMADRIHNTQGEAAYRAVGTSVEDVVFPSVHSRVE